MYDVEREQKIQMTIPSALRVVMMHWNFAGNVDRG